MRCAGRMGPHARDRLRPPGWLVAREASRMPVNAMINALRTSAHMHGSASMYILRRGRWLAQFDLEVDRVQGFPRSVFQLATAAHGNRMQSPTSVTSNAWLWAFIGLLDKLKDHRPACAQVAPLA